MTYKYHLRVSSELKRKNEMDNQNQNNLYSIIILNCKIITPLSNMTHFEEIFSKTNWFSK